jgi:hypothetical protein
MTGAGYLFSQALNMTVNNTTVPYKSVERSVSLSLCTTLQVSNQGTSD